MSLLYQIDDLTNLMQHFVAETVPAVSPQLTTGTLEFATLLKASISKDSELR